MSDTLTHAGETRWIVLGTDGRHVTLGRHTDPTEDEVTAAEAALKAAGLAGWLAVLRGRYYSRKPLEIVMVRPLGVPGEMWNTATKAFEAARKVALRPT